MAFFVGAVLLLSNSGGRVEANTGAPGENGISCGSCHAGGNFSPSLEFSLLDQNQMPVTEIEAGQNYNVQVRINTAAGNPRAFGFQMVALDQSNNSNAGEWGTTLPTGIRRFSSLSRSYVTHSTPRDANTFSVPWTAPSSGTADIVFYVAGLATNRNGSSSGDAGTRTSFRIPRAMISSSTDLATPRVTIYPNPTSDILSVSDGINQEYRIVDQAGRPWQNGTLYSPEIDVRWLPSGSYFLQLGRNTYTFIKK